MFSVITELDWLVPEWQRLWETSPNTTEFQHPSWLLAWWRCFGSGKLRLAVTIREGGVLVGVIPLCILREREAKKLMFLGAGLSDSADALYLPGYESRVGDALDWFLRTEASCWDIADLQPIPTDSPLLRLSGHHETTIAQVEPHGVLELPSRIEDFQNQLSPHFRERIRDAFRRAAKMGEVAFSRAINDDLDHVMDALLQFRGSRWSETNDEPMEPRNAARFFRISARSLLDLGDLRLFYLSIRGEIASILYAFTHRNHASLYLVGFDPAFARCSPGVLIISHALETFIGEGAVECDFLRGQEAFKSRWGLKARPFYALRSAR